MDRRLELQEILENVLNSRYVYFQPPESVKLRYPCIVYERNNGDSYYANNAPYTFRQSYTLTLIDPDPDSEFIKKLAALPFCRFDRHFASDNLNHDVFNIYY